MRGFGLRVLALLAWCLAARGPTLLPSAIEGDESLYLVIADRMRLGELPYTGIWDHKPAGLYLLFNWSLATFGRHVASVRLLATLAVFVSSLSVYGLARKIGASNGNAQLAALSVAPFSLLWRGTSANSEHLFIAPGLIGALLLLHVANERPRTLVRRAMLIAAGLAFGIALQVKYLALFESAFMLAAFALYELRRRESAHGHLVVDGALLIVAMALPTLAIGAYFAGHGAWRAFVEANVFANLRHSSSATTGALELFSNAMKAWLLHTAPLWACSAVLVAARLRAGARPLLTVYEWLCVAWVLVGFLEASATKQFYRHYYLVTLPPMSLLLASLASHASWLTRVTWRAHLLGIAVALVPLAAIGFKYYRPWISDHLAGRLDEPERVAALVRPLLSKQDTLYVVDSEPVIYFLAEATPATRYAFPPFLLDPHFSEVAGVDYRAELARIVARAPRCVVALKGSPGPRAKELRQMLGPEYRSRGAFETVDVLCRP